MPVPGEVADPSALRTATISFTSDGATIDVATLDINFEIMQHRQGLR